MGIIRGSFCFMAGTMCGIYIVQNYNVPNIKRFVRDSLSTANQLEQRYRKPKKPGDDAV